MPWTFLLNRCVLRPSRQPIDAEELIRCVMKVRLPGAAQEVSLETYVATNLPAKSRPPSLSTELDRDWSHVKPPSTLLLKFPGTAGRAERSSPFPANILPAYFDQANADPKQHYEAWVWNPPGYGGSQGKASIKSLVPAAESFAAQVLAARCDQQTEVWLCGNSLGCLPALSLAARVNEWLPSKLATPSIKLWLRNPPDLANVILRVADRYAGRFFMRRVVQHLPGQLCAINNAARSELPAVFLMSQYDELVIPEIQRSIHSAYAGSHRVVTLAGLDHSSPLEQRHLADVSGAANWLTRA